MPERRLVAGSEDNPLPAPLCLLRSLSFEGQVFWFGVTPGYCFGAANTARSVERGEVAVCKIAHSQKLAAHVSDEELDEQYRSEAALTISLMDLMAEESLIAQRLGRLGPRKRNAA
jgi:hypothetical protein